MKIEVKWSRQRFTKADIPVGYIAGLGRDYPHPKRSHLYHGDFKEPGLPMCRYGWNRDQGESYSIWRGNIGELGICALCIRRARQKLKGIEPQGLVEGYRAQEGS